MFFALPTLVVFFVYFLAAILPAVFLLRYIYRMDTVEKEPPKLLARLALLGVVAALCAMALEYLGDAFLSSRLEEGSSAYAIVEAFLVVAVAEEGMKFLFLRISTWKNRNFNYRFDAVVYAVFVSLGFAAFENILYVFGYGLSVAPMRALLSVPGHMGFAVFMGLFYGRAKLYSDCGNKVGSVINQFLGFLIAVFLHGLYDACALIGNALSTVIFVVFVVIMYITVIALIKRASRRDRPI